MQSQTEVWFPSFHALEYLYQENHSHFHNLEHILRVWTHGINIAQNYKDKINLNVLSAALLFHDVGRKGDLREYSHSANSAKWVNQYLPLLYEDFSKYEIRLISSLCALHNHLDQQDLTLELKILKDADALDRVRLPKGSTDRNYLRLDESRMIFDNQQNIKLFKEWKRCKKAESNLLETWKSTLRRCNLERVLPQHIINSSGIDSSKYQEFFTQFARKSKSIERKLEAISKDIDTGALRRQKLTQLENNLEKYQQLAVDEFTTSLIRFHIHERVYKYLRLGVNDGTMGLENREHLLNLYTKYVSELRISIKKQGKLCIEKALLSLKLTKKDKWARHILLNFISAIYPHKQTLLILNYSKVITEKILRRYATKVMEIPLKILRHSPTKSSIDEYPYLWLSSLENWIDIAEVDINQKAVDKVQIENFTKFLTFIIESENFSPLLLNRTMSCMNQYLTLIDGHKKYRKQSRRIFDQFSREYMAVADSGTFEGYSIAKNLNIFHFYDYSHDLLTEYLQCLTEILQKLSKSYELGEFSNHYLLPILLTPTFKKHLPEGFKLLLEQHSAKYRHLIQLNVKKIQYPDSLQVYYKNLTSKHLEDVIDNAEKYKALTKGQNYKLVTNITGLPIIESIIENESALLSTWNIVGKKQRALAYRLLTKDSYYSRNTGRDMRQREMLLRSPDILKNHVIYGTLQDYDRLISDKKIIEQLPSPTEVFTTRRYGNIVLVLKDEVLERTVFTLFDSLWEHRHTPVIYEDAKALYEYIRTKPLKSALDTNNPFTLISTYIEANIMNGLKMEEIEEILVPRKSNNRRILAKIRKKYPWIKIRILN